MDDLAFLKKLAECNDKEQMARCIENHKPMTNADRIRVKDDEGIARFFYGLLANNSNRELTVKQWLAWLQQPAEEVNKDA